MIEDTPVKLPEIADRFGKEIAGLVDGVTKLTRLELQSDRTKQAENFRKLVLAMSRDIRVLLVKLADRLHNMRTLHFVQDPERRKRISRETMEIYAPLAERIGMDAVKTELQTLAFAQLEPEAYDTIQARLNFLRGQGADVIEEVRARADTRLRASRGARDRGHRAGKVRLLDLGEDASAQRRVRAAFRHHGVPHCGAEQGGLLRRAGRGAFRLSGDRRALQGLHLDAEIERLPVAAHRRDAARAAQPEDRSADPHRRNERCGGKRRRHALGLQGAGQKADGTDVQRFRWVQDLLEILENSAAPDEFLEYTKLELYEDQVFCFTPKGQLIQLPRGATPVDFAYAVHSQVGDACVGAKINGQLMPLRYQLQHGDQVEIMTARGGTPSPQWERFVVTGKARARIRRFMHQQQRQQHLDIGRAELAKAFRQAGVDGSEKVLEPALKALKLHQHRRPVHRRR